MPTYTTQYVKNLTTGEPFTFEVPDKKLQRLEHQKMSIATDGPSQFGTVESLTEEYEFSFFPSYEKVREIFFDDGYSNELITQILTEFGVPETAVTQLINNPNFVREVRKWFRGITCDGERTIRTLKIVYAAAKKYSV